MRWPAGLVRLYVPGMPKRAWGADDAEWKAAMARARWVVTVEELEVQGSEGGRGPGARPPGHEPVSDGAAPFWAPREEFLGEAPEASTGEVARLLSGMNAGPSPRCESDREAPGGAWGWLSTAGLEENSEIETKMFPVAQAAVAHLLGRGGRVARRLEEKMGVLFGIADGHGGGAATVSLCGPRSRLPLAVFAVKSLAKGMRSILDHLPSVA